MKIAILILFALAVILILPGIVYSKRVDSVNLNCKLNTFNNTVRGDGFSITQNILDDNCRQELYDRFYERARTNKNLNEDIQVSLYSDPEFLNQISNLIGEQVYPVNSLDSQRCWIRYYYSGMKAQYYENYHHDKKRYSKDVKQYRLVIPIHDTSDSVFTIEDVGDFPFIENTGVILEAGNCLHKVKFTSGERLILIMDYTTAPCDSAVSHYSCRGVDGYFWWVIDVIWRFLSSVYYKIANFNQGKS
jgi:hypothetical protein